MRPPGLPASCPATTTPLRTCTRSLILWDADNARPPIVIPPPALVVAVRSAVTRAAASSSHLGCLALPRPPPIALFANTATGIDPAAWRAAGVETVHTLPCAPGAVDQAITAAAVDFVRGAGGSATAGPSLLALASSDADYTPLVRWASAQPGVHTVVIGGFVGARTAGAGGWRKAKLAGAAHHALLWSEVVEAAAAVGGGGARSAATDDPSTVNIV